VWLQTLALPRRDTVKLVFSLQSDGATGRRGAVRAIEAGSGQAETCFFSEVMEPRYISVSDHLGKRRKPPGCADLAAALDLAKAEKAASTRKACGIDFRLYQGVVRCGAGCWASCGVRSGGGFPGCADGQRHQARLEIHFD